MLEMNMLTVGRFHFRHFPFSCSAVPFLFFAFGAVPFFILREQCHHHDQNGVTIFSWRWLEDIEGTL